MKKRHVLVLVAALVPLTLLSTAGSAITEYVSSGWQPDTAFLGTPNPKLLKNAQPGAVVPGWWWKDATPENALLNYLNTQIPPPSDPAGPDPYEVAPGVWVHEPTGPIIPPGPGPIPQSEGAANWVMIDLPAVSSPIVALIGTGGSEAAAHLAIQKAADLGKQIRYLIVTGADESAWKGFNVLAANATSQSPLTVVESLDLLSAYQRQQAVSAERSRRLTDIWGTSIPTDENWSVGGNGTAWNPPSGGSLAPRCPTIAPFDTIPALPNVDCVYVQTSQLTLSVGGEPTTFLKGIDQAGGLAVLFPGRHVMIPPSIFGAFLPDTAPLTGTAVSSQGVINMLSSMVRLATPQYPQYITYNTYIPLHTRPITTTDPAEIRAVLQAQSNVMTAAVQLTLNGINAGETVDDIVKTATLPSALAASPYAGQFVNTLASTIRGIYNEYIGWFNGDIRSLSTLGTKDQDQILVDAAGGPAALLDLTRKAEYKAVDLASTQKALYMTVALRDVAPSPGADRIYYQLLIKAASFQTSAQMRNYYLTLAFPLRPTP